MYDLYVRKKENLVPINFTRGQNSSASLYRMSLFKNLVNESANFLEESWKGGVFCVTL